MKKCIMWALSFLLASCKKFEFPPASSPHIPLAIADTFHIDHWYIEPYLPTFDTTDTKNFIALFQFSDFISRPSNLKVKALYASSRSGTLSMKYLLKDDITIGKIVRNDTNYVEFTIGNKIYMPICNQLKEGQLENAFNVGSELVIGAKLTPEDTSITDLLKKINCLLKRNIDTVKFVRGI